MSKSNIKLLLVALTTSRVIDDKERRVRFEANSVQDLTDEEIDTLESLTRKTGKLHFREPITEGGKPVANGPSSVDLDDYAGQQKAMDAKTVADLKAYLGFHSVEFPSDADKAALLKLATAHEAAADDGAGDKSASLDGNL